MRFFAEHPGVYVVHCTEGKDRAGFVSALLECFMGAGFDEIVADYMRSFYNYYGITPDDARYALVMNSNIVKTLCMAFGVNDLKTADLSACATAYLKSCGLEDETLAALKKNLSAAPAAHPAPVAESDYVVAAGDCLWNLAARFYGKPLEWKRIAEANGLRNPGLILIGQRLRIPA